MFPVSRNPTALLRLYSPSNWKLFILHWDVDASKLCQTYYTPFTNAVNTRYKPSEAKKNWQLLPSSRGRRRVDGLEELEDGGCRGVLADLLTRTKWGLFKVTGQFGVWYIQIDGQTDGQIDRLINSTYLSFGA